MSDDNKIYNKVITIEAKEESKTTTGNTMVKITDHTGEKFSFFKKKKDGTSSQVAEQFKDMGLDEGSTVKIGYVIESYTDKKGVKRESHKIINFQETNDTPSQTAPQGKTSNSEAPISSQSHSSDKDELFWDKKAYKQCLWGFWLHNQKERNVYGRGIDPRHIDLVWEVFKQIEEDADRRFNPSKLREAVQKHAPSVTEELPTIQQDEPPIEAYGDDEDVVNVDGVPF